ncbi:FxSxx-COOH system tetratricopeptide repeat protein [Actinoallomurus purpureus]|uniref:FxSxx-COOH system tetratricopeptide repeat protein n=1 Tax=Actinoallomurus purpureus TaxID=478114 RepID=UPI0020922444|nr:FxSxx-COOH system tetratricopeptide repeat protein [Actinoallomurus purpureus]MCO6003635.1 FxSxx-COOH system tetratricopeptide repeat protein [Actinoallomurus purpureus]
MNTVEREMTPGVIVSFLASASGVGRTGAIANVAWILAAAGKRVLIVDWGTEEADTDQYLAPFHSDWIALSREVTTGLSRLMVNEARPERRRQLAQLIPAQVRRYLLPGADGRIESISGAPGKGSTLPPDDDLIAKLRNLLRASGYDYVLIDAPTDMSESVVRGAARFSDVVVMCFTIRRQAVETAARHTRRLREQSILPLRVMAMPTQVDDSDPERIAESRGLLRDEFEQVLADFDADVVEIPYFPLDAYDRRLAALMDVPETPGSPCAAYHHLARAVTGGEVGAPPAVTAEVRTRYRRALGLPVGGDKDTISIAYAPPDRPWADWIAAQFRLAGMNVERFTGADPARGPLIVVLSSRSAEPAGPVGGEVVNVRVGGPRATTDAVDLRDQTDESTARALLLSHFHLIPDPRRSAPATPAYPGGREPARLAYRLPARSLAFVGRDDELEALRDRLRRGDGTPWVLSGAAGVGKSEIVREYAHRFSHDYSVIWWISAQGRERVRHGLRALAERLPVQESGDPIQAALTALRTVPELGRWLLVYDNADDPEDLDGLLPRGGTGDVLITTRRDVRNSTPVSALAADEGVALLGAQVRGILPEEARSVAAAVEHLPLSLRLAAAWLRETVGRLRACGFSAGEATAWAVAEFHAQLDRPAVPAGDDHPPSARVCLELSLRALGEEELGALTVRLIQLCAFLSPEEVGLTLLCSSAMLDELSAAEGGEALREDRKVAHQVIWLAVRYGLAEVDWARRPALRTHRLLHSLVRAGLDAREVAERREQVLRALAAYAPNDADGGIDDHIDAYRELQQHVVASGALRSDDRGVRRWIIAQLGYLAVTGDAETISAALEMAETARARWERTCDPDDPLLARLLSRIADLRRDLGDNAGALVLDDAALEHQRTNLGVTHPRTLISGRGRGGTLRGMGRFAEALAEDQTTWTGFRKTFGDEHPETLMAAHDLAVSTYLMGDHRKALLLGQDTYRRRARLLGPGDHRTLGEAPNLGAYLRAMGRLDDSDGLLREALTRAKELSPHRPRLELRIAKELAITMRCNDEVESAYERSHEAYLRYDELFGDGHPQTLACGLSLAIAYHAIGETSAAVELGTRCAEAYDRVMGEDHPFRHVCRLDLGLFLLGAGDLDGSLEYTASAHTGLTAELGEQHPWAVAAAIGHACSLAPTDPERAMELEETVLADTGDFLGPDHPYAQILVRNLRIGRTGARGDRGYAAIDVPST